MYRATSGFKLPVVLDNLQIFVCLAAAIGNLICIRRADETTAQFRFAHSVHGRATGTSPKARRGRARMWNMCGR